MTANSRHRDNTLDHLCPCSPFLSHHHPLSQLSPSCRLCWDCMKSAVVYTNRWMELEWCLYNHSPLMTMLKDFWCTWTSNLCVIFINCLSTVKQKITLVDFVMQKCLWASHRCLDVPCAAQHTHTLLLLPPDLHSTQMSEIPSVTQRPSQFFNNKTENLHFFIITSSVPLESQVRNMFLMSFSKAIFHIFFPNCSL